MKTYNVPIKRFVGLKWKIYAYITEEDHECKRAKDINKNVVDDELEFEDCMFLSCHVRVSEWIQTL